MTTKKPAHTAGPWKANGLNDLRSDLVASIVSVDGLHVAEIKGYGSTFEQDSSNARLIAAAPELLQILKDLNYAFYVEGTPKAMKAVMAKSKALIRKATGEV